MARKTFKPSEEGPTKLLHGPGVTTETVSNLTIGQSLRPVGPAWGFVKSSLLRDVWGFASLVFLFKYWHL